MLIRPKPAPPGPTGPPAAPTTSTAAHVSIRFTPALSPLGFQLPAVHRPRTDAPVGCHLPHRPTIGDDRQDCLVPLLRHAHLPHARERDKSAEVVVTNQPKVCNASAEGLMRPVSRTCTRKWCRRQDSNQRPSV